MNDTIKTKTTDNDGVFHYQDLVGVFNDLFIPSYQTELVRGEDEPVYLPKNDHRALNQIVFAHGYFASALHEIAHWCIAGRERRTQTDFGYWYRPDGRTAKQQEEFQQVEVKPQALEWIFSSACGFPFHFSEDNLGGEALDMAAFKDKVRIQAQTYMAAGLPGRANRFARALAEFYSISWPPRLNTPS